MYAPSVACRPSSGRALACSPASASKGMDVVHFMVVVDLPVRSIWNVWLMDGMNVGLSVVVRAQRRPLFIFDLSFSCSLKPCHHCVPSLHHEYISTLLASSGRMAVMIHCGICLSEVETMKDGKSSHRYLPHLEVDTRVQYQALRLYASSLGVRVGDIPTHCIHRPIISLPPVCSSNLPAILSAKLNGVSMIGADRQSMHVYRIRALTNSGTSMYVEPDSSSRI